MSVISLDEWRKKQEMLSKLKSPSPQSIPWEELGLTHTEVTEQLGHDTAIYMTLDRAWRSPFKIKSAFARDGAFEVAVCASEGLITNHMSEDTYGDRWMITEEGMEAKRVLDDVLRTVIGSYHGPGDSPLN